MSEETQIPAGTYNIRGSMTVYTIVTVEENGEVAVEFDHIDAESHELDKGNCGDSVWNEDDNTADVPAAVRFTLIDKLKANPSAWDSTDGMRFDR